LSQNIILNGSFEKWTLNTLDHVQIIATTPDYFRNNVKLHPQYYYNKDLSSHFPDKGSDGISYIGLGSCITGSECVALELLETLLRDSSYVLSYDIFKPDIYTEHLTDKFQHKLVSQLPEKLGQYQFKSYTDIYNVVVDDFMPGEWHTLKDTIIANGYEKYLLVFSPEIEDIDIIYYFLYDNFRLSALNEACINVFFENASYVLSETAIEKIVSFVSSLKANPDLCLILDAYTNEIGSEVDNFDLSVSRATEVAKVIHKENPRLLVKQNHHGETESIQKKHDQLMRKVTLKFAGKDECFSGAFIIPQAILDTIEGMYALDQKVRSVKQPYTNDDMKLIDSISDMNTPLIDSILDQYNYIGLSQLGPDKMDYLALLLLNQNVAMLDKHKHKIRKVAEAQDCSPQLFPYLIDKIQVGKGKKQIFGTQYYFKGDSIRFFDILEDENLDKKREKYGLPAFMLYKVIIDEK